MEEIIASLPDKAKQNKKANKKYFAKLRKKPPKNLDVRMQDLHDETFEEVSCLNCANCCKTTGPLFTTKDVDRIAKFMKMKPKDFEAQYLRIDEENDLILQSLPCPFLASDNKCLIYEVRPKACAEFPHTDRKKFHQISHLTLKNIAICPAAFQIVEKMKARIKV